MAVNAVVLGIAPTKLRGSTVGVRSPWWSTAAPCSTGTATTVVIANGQFLDGCDLVPRGHPGDGRVEVQVYALDAGGAGPMRRRLPSGTHLPHPRITATTGRTVEVDAPASRAWPLTVDGEPATARRAGLRATVAIAGDPAADLTRKRPRDASPVRGRRHR